MLNAQRQLRLVFWGALVTIALILYAYWRSDKPGELNLPVPKPEVLVKPVTETPAPAPAPKLPDGPTPEEKLLATKPSSTPGPVPAAGKAAPVSTNGLAGAARNAPTTVEALGVWDRYLKAHSPDERRALMLEKPGLSERYAGFYTNRKGADPKAGEKIDDRELPIGHERWRVLTFKSDSRRNGLMSVAFRRDAEGHVRLDWESLVGHSAMTWQEFREKRVSEPALFRGYIIKDDYFNFEFTDEKKYRSFRVFSPDGAWALSAFCEKDSPEGRALEKLFAALEAPKAGPSATGAAPVKHLPVSLRLAFPEKAQSDHCVWIREIVGGQWFLPTEG